jgi:hypothetical protein
MYIYLTHRCALRPTPLFLQRTFSTFHPASPPASQHIDFVLIRPRDFGTLVVWGMLERQQKHINIAANHDILSTKPKYTRQSSLTAILESLKGTVVVELDSIVILAIISRYLGRVVSLITFVDFVWTVLSLHARRFVSVVWEYSRLSHLYVPSHFASTSVSIFKIRVLL